MAWLTIAFLFSIGCTLYCAAFSDDFFYRVLSAVTLVVVICVSLGWNAPSSPLAPIARFLAVMFAFFAVLLTPISGILYFIFGCQNDDDSPSNQERMTVFDEISKIRTTTENSDFVEYKQFDARTGV